MARIRTIKPEFWRDESLASVSSDACLLAIGLLNHCDDEGFFNANPKLVESDIFPLRELSNTTIVLIQELCSIGYITLYQGTDNKTYGHIVNFEKHQVINKKTTSKIKGLCDLLNSYHTTPVVLPTGKERKGKEMEGNGDICPPVGELPSCNHQEVINLYHKHLPTLRRVEVWNETRKGYLRQRWREVADELSKTKVVEASDILGWFAEFFDHIGTSKFLMGKVNSKDGRSFYADLEWILKPSNFAKIVEGKYHGSN
jgi:hypothetical protein